MPAAVLAIATALPPTAFTQAQCWEIIRGSTFARKLRPRSLGLLEKVLLGDNGIHTRHFALEPIERAFQLGPDELNQVFRAAAPKLAGQALRKALLQAGLEPTDLDALFLCTCTGYLCPGPSSYVAEDLGLRPDCFLTDLVGLGCGAALPTLRAAADFVAARPRARAACVAVEVCSAAFYLDDNPGVLISACLFADGAAAVILGGRETAAHPLATVGAFQTLHRPADRDLLRFETREGKLRNLLSRLVPGRAAAAVAALHAEAAPDPGTPALVHPGGRDVLEAVGAVLAPAPLPHAADLLSACGNLSSPSVLFVLDRWIQEGQPQGAEAWLTSFGAGFSAHACALEVAAPPAPASLAPDRLSEPAKPDRAATLLPGSMV
ncbi:MAG: stilbene synthase [Puniceicoccaceae bacterium]|nr:MAG: stilbene synthase [Puniceicoccaceae bacterium]